MKTLHKHIGLLCIKYAPSVLALTCSTKILLNVCSQAEKDCCLFAVNWINLLLNIAVLGMIYVLGKCFGYCWKHQSLCRITLWGYAYYAFFLISRVPKSEALGITIIYVCLILVLTLLYKEIK